MLPVREGRRASGTLKLLAGVLAVFYTGVPLLWMLNTSFKRRIDIVSSPIIWIPHDPTLENYKKLLGSHAFVAFFLNSLLIAVSATLLSMAIGTLGGYALARFSYPAQGARRVGHWVLLQRIIPPVITIVPFYLVFSKLHLLDTKPALIISYVGVTMPFVVWMTRSYFVELSHEVLEAAVVDGDTQWGVFVRIALPLARPGVVATGMFSFLLAWNELIFALIFTDTPQSQTLPIGIASMITQLQVDWGQICAAGTVMSLPIVILAFIVQKHIVRGLSLGAVKG